MGLWFQRKGGEPESFAFVHLLIQGEAVSIGVFSAGFSGDCTSLTLSPFSWLPEGDWVAESPYPTLETRTARIHLVTAPAGLLVGSWA